ncbi:MerR family transcriptional regulator [Gymnodinialimonas sp.]
MPKSAQAFRTIREVADWLDVAAHVLRFWESKFNQIKPVKRAGGRRYYRPADMKLVGGIKVLLHDRGLTIRGVQKMIADEGVEAVTSLSPPIDELIGGGDVVEMEATDAWAEDAAAETREPEEPAEVEAETAEPADPTPPEVEETAPPEPAMETLPEPEPDPTPKEIPPTEAPEPEPEPEVAASEPIAALTQAPAPAPTPPLPSADPAEGALGALAALAQLPAPQRAALGPQIAALKQLRDRMGAPAKIE